MKRICFIIISIGALIYIIMEVKKNKFSIMASLWWLILALVMVILAIFPSIYNTITNILNIGYKPSLIFIICILFLIFINYRNSKKIAKMEEEIIALGQNNAILEEGIKERGKIK